MSTLQRNTMIQDHMREILDSDQLQAIKHRGSNLLIIAGAGSGKTHTLTHRAISFLQDIEPENLMVITFTKKAANELLNRINKIVPEQKLKRLKRAWIGTIHSICWRMLMENGQVVGLKPNWSVLDMGDSERVMSLSAKPFGFYKEWDIKDLYQLYSYARNSMTDWRQWVKSQRFPNVSNSANVGKAIDSYNRRCRRSNRVDFDDLQVYALRLLENHPELRKAYQERFRVIMVDEYQDTNRIQGRLLELLSSEGNVITVVGDDAQSIYGFRAANIENILDFERIFHANRIILRTNYRSTPEIVRLANASIKNNSRQINKNISSNNPSGRKPLFFTGLSPNEEAKFVCGYVQEQRRNGVELKEQAVLFRVTRHIAALEIELKRANIPYVVVGGEDFFSLEHIKLVIDMARLLINPEDSIALGTIQDLMGFSSAAALEKIEHRAEQNQLSFWDIARYEFQNAASASKSEYQSLLRFWETVNVLSNSLVEGQNIAPVILRIIEFLTPNMKKKYPAAWEDKLEDFASLQTAASPFISLSDFINSVALDQFREEDNDDRKKLTLSTIHSAKGRQWETVFVIGLVEYWFPLNLAIQQNGTDEEERRLFYVAVTRAKTNLFLSSYGEAVNPYGKTMRQNLSRFISELPKGVYESYNGQEEPDDNDSEDNMVNDGKDYWNIQDSDDLNEDVKWQFYNR